MVQSTDHEGWLSVRENQSEATQHEDL